MMKEIIWDSFYLTVNEIESRMRWSGAGRNGGNIRTDNWRKVTICYFVRRNFGFHIFKPICSSIGIFTFATGFRNQRNLLRLRR
jgi:hypothetical protein